MMCSHTATPQTNHRHEMDRTKLLKPSAMFLTTYQRDFVNPSPHLLQSSVRARSEAPPVAAPTPQRVPWQHFYTTTNSTYGSFQSPLLSLDYSSPAATLGAVTPVTPVTLQQRSGDSQRTSPLLDVGDWGQLQYVFSGRGNTNGISEQTQREAARTEDGVLEEGVVAISSHVGLACCENFLHSLYKEAGLEHLLRTSPTPITCAERENGPYWQPFRQALRASGSRLIQCTCCAWRSLDTCFQMLPSPALLPPPPQVSGLSTFQAYRTVYSPEPSTRPLQSRDLNIYAADALRPALIAAQGLSVTTA